jgi:maltodextrin utilization protein YvdJ
VQVAQAAQAVQQQAQSLHAAAEVHAQKAQEATSQVASLQATAHVSDSLVHAMRYVVMLASLLLCGGLQPMLFAAYAPLEGFLFFIKAFKFMNCVMCCAVACPSCAALHFCCTYYR